MAVCVSTYFAAAAAARARRSGPAVGAMAPPPRVVSMDTVLFGGTPEDCLSYGVLCPANGAVAPPRASQTMFAIETEGAFLDVGGALSRRVLASPAGGSAVLTSFIDPLGAWTATPLSASTPAHGAAVRTAGDLFHDHGVVGRVLIARDAVARASGDDLFIAVHVNRRRSVSGGLCASATAMAAAGGLKHLPTGAYDAEYIAVFRFPWTGAGFEGIYDVALVGVDPARCGWQEATLRARDAEITPVLNAQQAGTQYAWCLAAERRPVATFQSWGLHFAPGLCLPSAAAPAGRPMAVFPVPAGVSGADVFVDKELHGVRVRGAGHMTVTVVSVTAVAGVAIALSAADYEVETKSHAGARVVLQVEFDTCTAWGSAAAAPLVVAATEQTADCAWALGPLEWRARTNAYAVQRVLRARGVGPTATSLVLDVEGVSALEKVDGVTLATIAGVVGTTAAGRPRVTRDPDVILAWSTLWASRGATTTNVTAAMPALHTAARSVLHNSSGDKYRAPGDAVWSTRLHDAAVDVWLSRADVVDVTGAPLGPLPGGAVSISSVAAPVVMPRLAALLDATRSNGSAASPGSVRVDSRDGLRSPNARGVRVTSPVPSTPVRVAVPAQTFDFAGTAAQVAGGPDPVPAAAVAPLPEPPLPPPSPRGPTAGAAAAPPDAGTTSPGLNYMDLYGFDFGDGGSLMDVMDLATAPYNPDDDEFVGQ